MNTMNELHEKHLNFRRLNWILFLIFLGGFVLVIYVDLANFLQEHDIGSLRIWIYDECVFDFGCFKNPAMFLSFVLSLVAVCVFVPVVVELSRIRRDKEDKRLATMIRYTAAYILVARLIEIYYIFTLSDLQGVLYTAGRLFVPIDALSLAVYMIFCFQVFLIEEVKNTRVWNRRVIWLGVAGFVVAFFSLLENAFQFSPLNTAIVVAAMLLIFANLIIAVFVGVKVLHVRKKISANRGALLSIGLQLFLFIVVLALTMVVIVLGGTLESYWFRTVKNALFTVQGVLYFPAFILPARKSRDSM
ncbi:MAG: hypothetical protein ACTSU5_22185 [Promethearchaeota archaeon]